jgi:hypothetical protein
MSEDWNDEVHAVLLENERPYWVLEDRRDPRPTETVAWMVPYNEAATAIDVGIALLLVALRDPTVLDAARVQGLLDAQDRPRDRREDGDIGLVVEACRNLDTDMFLRVHVGLTSLLRGGLGALDRYRMASQVWAPVFWRTRERGGEIRTAGCPDLPSTDGVWQIRPFCTKTSTTEGAQGGSDGLKGCQSHHPRRP